MSTTAASRFPASRHSRASRSLIAATVVCAVAIGVTAWPADETSSPAGTGSAAAYPGRLTGPERAAVTSALASKNARVQRIARAVAANEAGASALAEPGLLYHHGIDTSRVPSRPAGAVSAERFHHR